MTIRVLLADDQALIRAGFAMIIASEPDLEVVGEAVNGIEAVEAARTAARYSLTPGSTRTSGARARLATRSCRSCPTWARRTT